MMIKDAIIGYYKMLKEVAYLWPLFILALLCNIGILLCSLFI